MSAITKERIELFIKNPLDNGLTRGEQMELARIALTSLEAEPVAYIIQDSDARSRGEKGILRYFANISDEDINEYEITVTPLYAAPPAPVVPEEKPMPNPLSMYAVDAVAAIAEVRGWNACRAAMLQSGNFRENKNSSTNNFREIAETSTNYPVI
ncbi:TPA: Eaa protein, partial [Escherichia coli]